MKLDTNSMRDYDIACALRGPDLPNTGNLKWVLTCRIRRLVGCTHAPTRGDPVSLPSAERALAEVRADEGHLGHYLSHVYQAADHLGDANLRVLAFELMGQVPMSPERLIELAGGD